MIIRFIKTVFIILVWSIGACFTLSASSVYSDSSLVQIAPTNEKKVALIEMNIGELDSVEAHRHVVNKSESLRNRVFVSFIFLIGLSIVLLVLGTLLFIKYRRVKLKRDLLNIQLNLLRGQMNPQFIFNVLSAIKGYVLEKEVQQSALFLNDFAKLMRHVLLSTQKDFITLAEEVQIINYYLELQQLRFSDPFNFYIEVDSELDGDSIFMPPLISQPFVENAIEYGVRSLLSDGVVRVIFKKKSDALVIVIEDNGIGFYRSMKEKNGTDDHQSLALKRTQERLTLVRRLTKRSTDLRIFDRRLENPLENGVRVEVEIPLIS